MSGPDPGDTDDGPSGHDEGHRKPSDETNAPDKTEIDDPSGPANASPGEHDASERDTSRNDSTDTSAASGTDSDSDTTIGSGSDTATGSDDHTVDDSDAVSIEDDGIVRWFLKTNDGTVVFARDVLSSVAIVAVIGLLLFGLSGVWPPLVAVESGSMEPNMVRGDLIFVVDGDRFVGNNPVDDTGIVPAANAEESGHETFGQAGDVVIFRPDGSERETPIIHRAHYWVEEGENWVDTKANEAYVDGASCDDVGTCPATHDGFITKGDDNPHYDQYTRGSAAAQSDVVQTDWITGKAQYRIPYLGHVRLTFDSILGTTAPTINSGELRSMDTQVAGGAVVGATGVSAIGVTAGVAITRRRR